MTETAEKLSILLIEDDHENLELMRESLPKTLIGYKLFWDLCGDFDEALEKLEAFRYDVVVTDVYRDRPNSAKGSLVEDAKASGIVAQLRARRFCPIVMFSDGSMPTNIEKGPLVRFADKSSGDAQIIEQLTEIIETEIPQIARRLHDDLDKSAGSYLWKFLEVNWDKLKQSGLLKGKVLERLIRRRASVQIGRLDGDQREISSVEGAEFYIHPPIAGNVWRMGEIVRREAEFRVILTPHCHLQPQHGQAPRAEFVLTVKTVTGVLLFQQNPMSARKANAVLDEVRRRIQSPASIGKPEGRYWFLPGFLDMPDLYCDFMQLESISMDILSSEFERFAVLDAPFAEAMQSCFAGFYSSVGLPGLDPARFSGLNGPGISDG